MAINNKTMNNSIKQLGSRIQSFLKDPFFLRRWDISQSHNNDYKYTSVYIGRHDRKATDINFHAQRFIEDMCNGLMPFTFNKESREKYPATTNPPSKEKEFLIANGIRKDEYTGTLEDELCDFVRLTAKNLLTHGVAIYEIGYKKDKNNKIDKFRLKPILPFRLMRFMNNYYQFVLWKDAKRLSTKVQILKIPAQNVLRIDFPNSYGGKRKLLRSIKRIAYLSKQRTPKFSTQNIRFNMNDYFQTRHLEMAKITRGFGWDNLLYPNSLTEYYTISLFLKKKKFEATIRNLIISNLNEVLSRKPLDLNVEVTMKNLFTVEDVDEQQKKLESGNIKFIDILNSLKI